MTLKRTDQPAPWLYLFSVITWTWTFLGIVALSGQPWLSFPTVLLTLLGGLGPVIVPALLITAGRWDSSLDRTTGNFFRRALDPRTLPWHWYGWMVALLLLLHVGPLLLNPATLQTEGILAMGPALFLLIGFIFGALEEPGWRGYAQEGLQRRMPVVAASLVIGLFWAIWHLPLFLIADTYQAGLGIGTPAFWGFHLAILISSPLYAWLYNVTGRVIFAPLLFHGLGNVVGEMTVDALPAAMLGVTAVLALVIIVTNWSVMGVRRG